MPKIITKTVYTYAELLDLYKAGVTTTKAIARAKDWLREGQTNHDWFKYHLDMWKEALEQIGFCEPVIQFSGFWSQGDGASFTARIDIEKLAGFMSTCYTPQNCITGQPEDLEPWIVYHCNVTTNQEYSRLMRLGNHLDNPEVERISSHYVHDNTCRVNLSFCGPLTLRKVDNLLKDFAEDVERLRKSICKAIYKMLQDDYDYLTSDEAIAESAEANGYTFTVNGTREG